MATFGQTSIGGTEHANSTAAIVTKFTAPEDGTITSMSAYVEANSGTINVGMAIYSDSSGTAAVKLAEDSGNVAVTTYAWYSVNISLPVVKDGVYWLGVWADAGMDLKFDATGNREYKAGSFETWPDPFAADGADSRTYSVYATYTPATNIKKLAGITKANSKKVIGVHLNAPELAETTLLSDGNLQGYWRLESDGTDSSGNSNTLTGSGTPTYAAGKFNNGVDLELSSSQYLSRADTASLSITGDISIGCWIKLEQLPSTAGTIFMIVGKDDTSAQRSYIFYLDTADKLTFTWYESGAASATVATVATVTSADVGVWTYVAATADVSATDAFLYKNGLEVANSGTSGTNTAITDTTADFEVGARNSALYFDGMIDDAAIFDRILTAAEILYLYNGGIKELAGVANQ